MSYVCNVAKALDLLGGKWGTLILRELVKKPMRFSEIRDNIDNINTRTLTLKLKHLQRNRIITRTVYAEVPPRVVYGLTEYGNRVKPVIDALRMWGGSQPPAVMNDKKL